MKSLTSRTTLITAVAVAGVLIAGTAAIAANIGILNASNDSSIGSLSATDDLVPSTTVDAGVPAVVEIAKPASTNDKTQQPTTTVAAAASYVVDDAGTVSVTGTPGALTLVEAAASPGWTPTATQPDPLSLRVVFANGTRTVIFTATLDADGEIDAEVTEPVIVVGAAPNSPVATPMSPSDDDQYESDDDQYESDDEYESDDDESESDDDDDDEYESDDDDEYEGADDDD